MRLRTRSKPGPHAGIEGPVVVSFTDFHVLGLRNFLGVIWAGARLRRNWRTRPGAVGLAVWAEPLKGRLGSLSAWLSEDDLRRFLRSPEHVAVVRSYGPHMTGSSELWCTGRFVAAEAWREADRRQATARF